MVSTWVHTLLIDMGAFHSHIWSILRWAIDPEFSRKIDIDILKLQKMIKNKKRVRQGGTNRRRITCYADALPLSYANLNTER